MPPAPLILTEQLTKDYGAFRALDSLDLAIPVGEIFGLLGPNGSGKSTAIRILLGFMQATSGRASIGGFDSWAAGVEVRRQVAYLPGELRLYENMTGRQLIRFLGQLRGERPGPEAERLARQLDIDINRPLTHMSSGMKRKVALLTVLTSHAPLIILDEPTNTLDPVMRDQLLEQLSQARDRGQTVMFSSHVLSEVEQICDRVGILQRGRLVHVQPMKELREGRFVRVRFAHEPELDPHGEPLVPSQRLVDGSLEMTYLGPLPDLLRWLNQHPVMDLTIEPSGLTPIYRRYHGASE